MAIKSAYKGQIAAFCSMCGKRTAEMLCVCTLPETFLCVQCMGPHYVKGSGRPHTIWPVDQLAHYKAPGYSERVQVRVEQFPQVRAQMLGQVSAVDRAVQEFSEAMDRIIGELTRYRSETVRKLQGLRAELSAEVETALAEVERTLVEDRPQLSSKYGQLVRELTERMHPFELFSYSLKPPPHVQILHYQLSQTSQPSPYAALLENQLTVVDLKTQETTKHTLAVDPGYPGYIALDGNTLMLIGKKVMTVDLLTFQVTILPNLLTPRDCTGVAKVGNVVYAFGGMDGIRVLRVCEKWNMQQWSRLGDMHYARGYFTPCHFQSLIYLAASRAEDHRAVESFSPLTDIFTVLPVSLPHQLELKKASVAFVANGELFLLTEAKQMVFWEIKSGREFRLSVKSSGCWSRQQPLIVGTEVFIAYGSKVVKWSVETREFT